MALMRWVVSLALFLRSFKMDLFSLKMRLISLPRSFLNSSKATGFEGGVLGLRTEGEVKEEKEWNRCLGDTRYVIFLPCDFPGQRVEILGIHRLCQMEVSL